MTPELHEKLSTLIDALGEADDSKDFIIDLKYRLARALGAVNAEIPDVVKAQASDFSWNELLSAPDLEITRTVDAGKTVIILMYTTPDEGSMN